MTAMTRTELLETARKTVCGEREQDYGSPENSFQRIAEFWGTYLNQQITPVDVAAMMALLKLARVAEGHGKADNWVDLAGYAACGAEIESGAVQIYEGAPLKHADCCMRNHPSCECLTCKHDSAIFSDCCMRHGKYDGGRCTGINNKCQDYEKEGE